MGQQSKKTRGGAKAAGAVSAGGAHNSEGVSKSITPLQGVQHSAANPEKQERDGDARDGSMWGRLLSRPGRSLVSHGQQASARGHAPSPTSHKARGPPQAEAGGTGGRNGLLATSNSARAVEGQVQTTPRSGQTAAATGAEDRKRKSQKDRLKQSYAGGKKSTDKHSLALGAYIKRLFSYDFRVSFRSRLIGWVVNLAVAAAVIGIFALKAAEEFYGQDLSRGAQREEHLTALQLDASASEMDIRKAYRTLSIRWHPDKNPGCASCQARFTEVAAAYEYLMKDFRKQKEEQATPEGATAGGRGPTAQDEDHEGKTGKSDIVDFTYLSPSEPFYPATDKQVWTILLRHGEDEFTDRVYEMWAETALALGKYVKYGLVDVHKNKSILKRLPVKVKIFPAIFVVSHGMHPELYPAITHPSVENIRSFISRSFPNRVSLISSASDLRTYLRAEAPPFSRTPVGWLAQPYKVVLLPAADSPVSPPVALKATAMKYQNIFLFAYVQNVRGLLLEGTEAAKTEFVSLLRQPPSSAAACKERQAERRGVGEAASETEGGAAEAQLDGGCSAADQRQHEDAALELTETDLKNYLTLMLFTNEGAGTSSRVVERLRIPNLFSRRESQRVAFAKLPRLLASHILPRVHPYLYQQNAPLLCRGTPQERLFTLVVVEPPRLAASANTGGLPQQQAASTRADAGATAVSEEEFTLAEVANLVEASRRRYVEKGRRAVGAAAAQQEDGQETTDKEEQREAEDYAAEGSDEDDDNTSDASFRLQIARISFDSPAGLPGLPGIPSSSPFVDFWKDQLHSSRVFLLHLDGSRYALLSSATDAGGEDGGQGGQRLQAATKELLSELYQVLEKHVQQHRFGGDSDYEDEDEEDNAASSGSTTKTRLVWHPLPAACDWTHFIKNCLPSAAAPWWWDLLTGFLDISFVQLGVLSVLGVTIYFFGSNMSYEALVGVILCGSLLTGGFEHARSMCNKLWANWSAAV